MGFYGGRAGKSFQIERTFISYEELYAELLQSASTSPVSSNQYLRSVPVSAFVLISYGNIGSEEYSQNREADLTWLKANKDKWSGNGIADYNSTLWWNIDSDAADYNGSVWVKKWVDPSSLSDGDYRKKTNGYFYTYIANIAGITPEIINGYWYIGQQDTGIRAEGRQVEFQVLYDEALATYALLNRDAEYGLSNLKERYELNDLTSEYEPSEQGTFILVYKANDKGEFIIVDNDKVELGYFLLSDWNGAQLPVEPEFKSDWLYWKYTDETEWKRLFEITDLLNSKNYMISASGYAQEAESLAKEMGEVAKNVDELLVETNENIAKLNDNINIVAGYAESSKDSYEGTKELIDALVDWDYHEVDSKDSAEYGWIFVEEKNTDGIITYVYKSVRESSVTPEDISIAEIIAARGGYEQLGKRLDKYTAQYDLISDMQKDTALSRGKRAFTFGIDTVGDDDSKIFAIFDPKNTEDAEKLAELDEEGKPVIKEQYNIANGLVAGLLTIFSGKGGGGGGGVTTPTLSVATENITANSGSTVEILYSTIVPANGDVTLFVKDNLKGEVLDAINPSINYSLGHKIPGNRSGSIQWKPSDGVHTLTIYFIDRQGVYSNEVRATVTAGGISLTTKQLDGQQISSNTAASITYSAQTIYKTDPVILTYEITQNNNYVKGGEIVDQSSGSQRTFQVLIKTADEDIGKGQFKITARARVQGRDDVISDIIIRSFIIAEQNVIYLTTSYDESIPQYAEEPTKIPYTLTYNGGSIFTVKAYVSDISGFIPDEDTLKATYDGVRAGANTAQLIFEQPGTYYLVLAASGIGITATGRSEEIKVNIQPAENLYQLQQQGLLLYHISARRGQQNTDANKNIWESIGTDKTLSATLYDFNFSSNGWADAGSQMNGYLICNNQAYVKCGTFNPFKDIYTTYSEGLTFECVFKAREIGEDSNIFEYAFDTNASTGLFINNKFARMKIGSEIDIRAYFEIDGIENANTPIHVAFVADMKNRYAKIYLNGVVSAAAEIPENSTAFKPSTADAYMLLGKSRNLLSPKYAYAAIDCLRVYNGSLTEDELLKNYIYNIRNKDTQKLKWEKNNLDSDSLIADKIPSMTFYTTASDWASMTKDIKKNVNIQYDDPVHNEHKIWKKVKTSWQGTSSIAYPVKNFKIKLGEKFALAQGRIKKEKTFCLKADYMDSSHTHNTGNANFIHDTGILSNFCLTPPQCDEIGVDYSYTTKGLTAIKNNTTKPEELKNRSNIYGSPIVLYVAIETPESEEARKENPDLEPVYEQSKLQGIYNFNLDKGSTDSFGLYREDPDTDYSPKFEKCTSFEIAANTAYSSGGFRMVKFMKNASGSYGWARPKVLFRLNDDGFYSICTKEEKNNSSIQKYYSVVRADQEGTVLNESKILTDTYQGDTYTGIFNPTIQVKGYYDDTKRYSLVGEDYVESSTGTYIGLYAIDTNTNLIKISSGLAVFMGFYDYSKTYEWTNQVPIESLVYEQVENWNIINLPKNLDYYYDYYISDFELRFPDMDMYLCNVNGIEKYNQLMNKEYDKIISLVEWVDSHSDGEDDGETFINGFGNHVCKNNAFAYYLMTTTTGLIDNFGKNLMIDTWGYDVNGELPLRKINIGGTNYHFVTRYESNWDYVEEIYTDEGQFLYGWMDIDNPVIAENGKAYYNVYRADSGGNFFVDENGQRVGIENRVKYYLQTEQSIQDIGEAMIALDEGETVNIPDPVYDDKFVWSFCDGDRIIGWNHEIKESQMIWYPHFYDLDSCLGVDNSGNLIFAPSIEMKDTYYINYVTNERVNSRPFNTADSALWGNMVDLLSEEIQKFYVDKAKSILTIDNFTKYYKTNIIDITGERWYNADAYPKYLSREPIHVIVNGKDEYRYPKEFISICYGTDWSRTKNWLTDRIAYLDSYYYRNSSETGGAFELRGNTLNLFYNMKIECYKPMYMRISYKNGDKCISGQAKEYNGTVVIRAPSALQQGDQEIYIMPASNVKRFICVDSNGNPNRNAKYKSAKIGTAKNLLELNLSGSNALDVINWPDAGDSGSLIRSINLNGCTSGDKITVNCSQFPLLQTLDIRNSACNVTFGIIGGALQTAYLNSKTAAIDIRDQHSLSNLVFQMQYNKEPLSDNDVVANHNHALSSFKVSNCEKLNLTENSFEFLYPDNLGNLVVTPANTTIKNFIENKGPLSLFKGLNELTIENSMMMTTELLLALPSLSTVNVTRSNINKVTFVANDIAAAGTLTQTAFPGTGGNPDVEDHQVQDGFKSDDSVKILEFRGPDKTNGKTSGTVLLPWRVYLGSLIGLQELNIFCSTIKPKTIDQNHDGYQKLVDVNGALRRFELILPTPNLGAEGFRTFFVNPSVSNLDFTCIRQTGIDYNTSSIPSSAKGEFVSQDISNPTKNIFTGIDVREFNGLTMNFRGLGNITAILGMNFISPSNFLAKYGSDGFVSFFEGCKSLKALYRTLPSGTLADWTFENEKNWIANGAAHSTRRMFYNCNAIEKKYLIGMFNYTSDATEDMSYMFANCYNLIDDIVVNFPAQLVNVNNIKGMFSSCIGIRQIKLSVGRSENIDSLESLFDGCVALENVILSFRRTSDQKNGLVTIKSTASTFKGCLGLKELNLTSNYQGGQDWDLSNLEDATSMFQGCANLISVIFPDKYKLSHLISGRDMFNGCASLVSIFTNSTGNGLVLNDNIFNAGLDLTNMLLGCNNLKDVGSMIEWDVSRVTSVAAIYSGCQVLQGSESCDPLNYENKILDLSKWKFNGEIDISSMFYGARTLVGVIFPDSNSENSWTVSRISSLFNSCRSLKRIDISGFKYGKTLINVSQVFQDCVSASSINGYQNFPTLQINDFSQVFSGCSALVSLDLTSWKCYKARSIDALFQNCISLTNIKGLREIFGTQTSIEAMNEADMNIGLTSAREVFDRCSSLIWTTVGPKNETANKCDISLWGYALSTVSDSQGLNGFFRGCTSLPKDPVTVLAYSTLTNTDDFIKALSAEKKNYFGKWPFNSLVSLSNMFDGCYNLTTLNILQYVIAPKIINISGMINGCSQLTTLNLSNLNLDTLIPGGVSRLFDGCNNLYAIGLKYGTLKVNLNISPLLAYLPEQLDSDVHQWLYDFSSAPPVDESYGRLTMTSSQESGLNVNKITEKGWRINVS